MKHEGTKIFLFAVFFSSSLFQKLSYKGHTMKIYVGNMSYDVTEEDLRQVFGKFGQVESVAIINDKITNRPKGFGFVEMATSEAAQAAITALNGKA